jgi:phosphonate transport system ATP-binding protein
MAQQAELILADEPIASLDPESSRRVMESLSALNREDRRTVIVSLHQVDFAVRYCPRTVALKDGRIHFDGPTRELSAGFLRELYGARDAMELGLDSLAEMPAAVRAAGGEQEQVTRVATA